MQQFKFPNSRIPALDGIRGIAILLVFAVHTTPVLLYGGRIGVDLFFVLSGFLITSILLKEQRLTGSISLFNFYVRRALRLFPALVLMAAFVVTYAWSMQSPHIFDLTLHNAAGVMLYYFNWQLVSAFPNFLEHQWMFSHVWSLSVEEQFYILWPTILIATFTLRGSNRVRVGIAIAGIILPAVIRSVLWKREPSLSLYFQSPLRADGLMWGSLTAMLIDAGIFPVGKLRKVISLSTITALLGLLGIASREGLANGFLYLVGFSVVGLFSAILIYGSVVCPHPILMRVLIVAPLRWVGKISYGLYLWHWPIIRVVAQPQLPPLQSMLLEFSLTLAVAAASFYLIEIKFLKLKEMFAVHPRFNELVQAA